jgi:membrane associated rhomboid family serine protease
VAPFGDVRAVDLTVLSWVDTLSAMRSVTALLIGLNLAVYALQQVWGDRLIAEFALWPLGRFWVPEIGGYVGFEPWQLITCAFLHANLTHIFFNMFGLYMFGGEVERNLGSGRFLMLYVVAILTASAAQLLVASLGTGDPTPTLGASGGVFGLLLAFGMLFPRRIVTLIFPPIPMPAWLFVTLYGLLELGSGVFGTQAGVAHFAHLGGMLGAFVLLQIWRSRKSM